MGNYLYSVLTVNCGGYEAVKEVENPRDDVEYICVTDNPDMTSQTWKMVCVPNAWFLDIKHDPYQYVSSDVCLWLDGSYKIKADFTDAIIRPFIESDKELMISLHDVRHNIYEEALNWHIQRGMSIYNCGALAHYLIFHNIISDTLFQTSFILTKRTDDVQAIYRKVRELERLVSVDGRYRDDQTIFSAVMVAHYYRWDKIWLMNFESLTQNNPYFKWCIHGTENPHTWVKQMSFRCFDEDVRDKMFTFQ